ncbi:hypothetical protein [Chengkuizengella sediminis]|uniref:hypothetical protein n=1 Tax=Chengkuizengella sediminis TaxID=1885917 RepID=UPI00138A63C7|nr:hypothetical protein [Chengkuizengella sediminis]NDI33420.1 hypothetical protein [Chengkuizengella sediminis]
MSIFNKTKCDCCVCPMQFVLKQLVGQTNVRIFTPSGSFSTNIIDVNEFILFTTDGDVPICNISAVRLEGFQEITLEPPIKNSVGVCSCCEDPMTNILKSHIGGTAFIEIISPTGNIAADIIDVGEGIVFVNDPSTTIFFFVISTCAITRIIPLN